MSRNGSFLIVFVAVGLVSGSPFRSCGKPRSSISKLEVEGCADSSRSCILRKGTDAKITITFTPTVKVDNITVKAYGIIEGVPLPYPLPNSNGCNETGLHCPLIENIKVTYSQKFPVKPFFPSLSLDVKWTFVYDTAEELLCALIPVRIQ